MSETPVDGVEEFSAALAGCDVVARASPARAENAACIITDYGGRARLAAINAEEECRHLYRVGDACECKLRRLDRRHQHAVPFRSLSALNCPQHFCVLEHTN